METAKHIPDGGKYIFPYIALAAYKLVTKTVVTLTAALLTVIAARKLATELLSISNCVVSIYKQLEDVLLDN